MVKKLQRDSNKKEDRRIEEKANKNRNKLIIIGVIAAVVAAIAFVSYRLDTTRSDTYAVIDGIECDTTEYVTFHIHAHLDVFVDGKPAVVPAQIGIEDNTCLYWLHTHSPDGVIHMESPTEKQFTLGQFFDIWKSTGPGVTPTGDSPIIYVNGHVVTTDLKDTPLNAHDEIVLVYGNPPPNIPAFYQFPEGE